MNAIWEEAKRAVAETARELARLGLVAGSSGNVSTRLMPSEGRELLTITASRKACASLAPQDVVVVDFEADPVEGELVPSSETMIHVGIYKARPDVQAVIHSHPIFATIVAVAGLDIPPIVDEMAILVGGTVKVAEYGFPGSEELAQRACQALEERKAVLLRNHGMVSVGGSLEEALEICHLVERIAQIFVYSSLLGKINTLPPEVVEAEKALFQMRLKAVLLIDSRGGEI